jgi:hypothetical protein
MHKLAEASSFKILFMNKKRNKNPGNVDENEQFPLPVYKDEDDIYSREKKESFEEEVQPLLNEPDNVYKNPGEGLDIPGSELDDADEAIGEEDEENNYYSLGGDNHNDLEEDN